MSIMDLLVEPTDRPRKMMLYGVAGIGKSTWAAGLPLPVAVQTEDGLRNVSPRPKSFGTLLTYDKIMQILSQIANDRDRLPFATLFVDTMDGMERLARDKVCEVKGVKTVSEIGYGKGYDAVTQLVLDFLNVLEQINLRKGVMIVLLSHAEIERFNDPYTDPYDRYRPRGDKRVWPEVVDWCDDVLFVNYKKYTEEKDEGGFNKTRTKAVGTGERILFTTENPCHIAKNRLSMPAEIDFSWVKYHEYIQKAKQAV